MVENKILKHFFLNITLDGTIGKFIMRIKNEAASVKFRNLAGDVRGMIYLKKINVEVCDLYFNMDFQRTGFKPLSLLKTKSLNFIPVKLQGLTFYSCLELEEVGNDLPKKYTIQLGDLEYFYLDEKVSAIQNFDLIIELTTEKVSEILEGIMKINKCNKNKNMYLKRKNKNIVIELVSEIDFGKLSIPITDLRVTKDNGEITVFEYFDVEAFHKILKSNTRKFNSASIKISSKGLMQICFINDYMESSYWLLGNRELIQQKKG